MEQDFYFTIQQAATAEVKIKGSRFIGQVQPAAGREQAEASLAQIRKRWHDATHHCFAWRVGYADQESNRSSDDGEPSGTAGRPILQALCASQLSDVLLVVTRYFGGVKLGTGGLARAYAQAAAQTLQQAGRRQVVLSELLKFELPYEWYGLAQNLTEKFSGKIARSEFDQGVLLQVLMRQSQVQLFIAQMIEQSNGKIKLRSDQ
jgi:uncharacterized YigZ family protein